MGPYDLVNQITTSLKKDIVEVEPGKVAGVLYDAGHFPYLVADVSDDRYVIGEWLRIEDDSALVKLDMLEDLKETGYEFNHYDRIELIDTVSAKVKDGDISRDPHTHSAIPSNCFRRLVAPAGEPSETNRTGGIT